MGQTRLKPPDDSAGPTPERFARADGDFDIIGRSKENRRITMQDDALARAHRRAKISGEEYSALKRYALHWLAGGLQGPMQSVDLNRIFAFDPASMTGLAKTERQQDHRDAYRAARSQIGWVHPEIAFVADHVACFGNSLRDVGLMLGYRSVWHASEHARALLVAAGDRLGQFWKDRDR